MTGLAGFYKATPDGKQLFLSWISPGEVFGLAALQLQPQGYLTTVKALRNNSVLVWERRSARALISQIPRLGENAYAVAAEYSTRLANALVARASETAQQRLCRMLIASARQVGRTCNTAVELRLTNEQLAEMADVSYYTVCRQLSEWQREGVLAKRRGKILLLAPQRLS